MHPAASGSYNSEGTTGLLGVINFYRRFIPAATRILKPLTDQLKAEVGIDTCK